MDKMKRRAFIQTSAAAGVGLSGLSMAAESSPAVLPKAAKSQINIGLIGMGMRGQSHLSLLLNRSDCRVTAICDIDQYMLDQTKKMVEKKGAPMPKVYGLEERAYLEMLEDSDLDAVIISTPWRWHSEMAIAAMNAGKYVGVEVSGGFSLDECWQLVNTHEATGTHLFFLENVCYRRDVMAVLQMVREGLFGELIHLEGGYQHDLRGVKFNDGATPYDSGVEFGEKGFSEAKWRTIHSIHRNGDLYPTHGIGPVANYIGINRGNRFLYLSSMASKSRG
ncbi:MAG: Gfo/Idh/MocA family oxidoreductase, partial [Saprospiraceae bacterium]|nr:Gfo/Idh/MocA family oxidoreductase [Saprospiraceae bacterium]